MKYLLTFNIKYIFVFTAFAFALLFAITVSGIEQPSAQQTGGIRGNPDSSESQTSQQDDNFTNTTIGEESSCAFKSIGECKNAEELVNVIYKSLFVFGGILGVFMIMFRGIAITIATAQGAVVKRDEALTDFGNVIIGLGLLALSYIILNTINPDILSF